jgi:hypothetical protein
VQGVSPLSAPFAPQGGQLSDVARYSPSFLKSQPVAALGVLSAFLRITCHATLLSHIPLQEKLIPKHREDFNIVAEQCSELAKLLNSLGEFS